MFDNDQIEGKQFLYSKSSNHNFNCNLIRIDSNHSNNILADSLIDNLTNNLNYILTNNLTDILINYIHFSH